MLFTPPNVPALDSNANPIEGAEWRFTLTGTTTPTAVYADAGLNTSLGSEVEAEGGGRFPAIFLDPTIAYRARCFDASGTLLPGYDFDPLPVATASDIQVVQSGTGASTESLQEALRRGFVWPHQFLEDGQTLGAGSDDSDAFQRAIDAAAGRIVGIPYDATGYKINTPLVLPENTFLLGFGKPRLFTTIAGQEIASATTVDKITVQGIAFQGAGASTSPLNDFGGESEANTGLLTCTACGEVRILDCEFSAFFNGVTAQLCAKVWIERNIISDFQRQGVLGTKSSYAWIEANHISDCNESGPTQAYGIHVTGDQNGGDASVSISIINNHIDGVPSWDGIMTHDGTDYTITGNTIRDVRIGIDVGHADTTNIIKRISIADNRISATTTDTWVVLGVPQAANHGGILVRGKDATHRLEKVTVADNVIEGFFNIASMVGTAGESSNITVGYADDVTCSGNVIAGGGSTFNNAGILVIGTVNRIAIGLNVMQGTMALGGIRFAGVTADLVSLGVNTIKQANTSHEGVYLSSTTATIAMTSQATNSSVPFSYSGGTLTYAAGGGPVFAGSVTYDPASLNDGAGATTTVTATGAEVGDAADAGFGVDLQGITVTAYVNTANSIAVRFQNESGGTLDLASSTLKAIARRL